VKSAIVIGAGFAGLAAAACLAKKGLKVTLLEKNSSPGGRARKFSDAGFTFDMGPSWYWMPDVFEAYFNLFGKSTSDFYELTRLDPSYRVFFDSKETMDLPADREGLNKLFESLEPGSSKNLNKFLTEAEYKYRVGMTEFVHKPSLSLMEFADFRVLKSAMRLSLFSSLAKQVDKLFKHPKLRELLKFPVLFLGATPEKTPALYSLMNYADMVLGTWYPKGGMFQIVDAMVKIAKNQGVEFKYDEPVEKIEVDGKQVSSVITNQGSYQADVVVGAGDYHHIDQHLLGKNHQYSAAYWNNRVMAPSCLIFYLGIRKKLKGLLHHNLFFDADFKRHANEIYNEPAWPKEPLFYACLASKTDPSCAPDDCENLFLLMPVAPGLDDDEKMREKYYGVMMERLEMMTGQPILPHVVYKRSYALNNFVEDYHAFKGNAYGLANTLKQTAILKPSIKHKKVKNLYFTGQLTTPGPGVPPSLISGQVVAAQVAKDLKLA